MKKVALLFACCISVLLFASCTKETIDLLQKKPNVEFLKAADHPSDNYSISIDEAITFAVRISPNEESNAALTEFIFQIKNPAENDVVVFEDRQTISTDIYDTHEFEETFKATEAGNYTVYAIVKDEAGAENIAMVYLDCAAPIVEPIGTFTGNLKIAGTVIVSNPFTGESELALDPMDIETTIELGNTSEGPSEAILNIDGATVTLQCVKQGDTFTFDSFHFTKPIDLTVVNIDFDIEITDMIGELYGDVLTITATAKGSGAYPPLATATLEGVMDGSLNKVQE